MGNKSTVQQKSSDKVTKFYSQRTKKNENEKKLEMQKKEKRDVIENIEIINRDWLGEVPTFQEASNPFGDS